MEQGIFNQLFLCIIKLFESLSQEKMSESPPHVKIERENMAIFILLFHI
jgi:hypothetical protein